VVLENAKGFSTRHRDVLKWIRGALQDLKYWVSCRVLNAKDHGVPQNRERLLIVGIHRLGAPDAASLFEWPKKLPRVSIEDFLDPKTESDNPRRLPPASQTGARKHVRAVLTALKQEGLDPATAGLIVNCDGAKCQSMCGVSPCITRARACNGGHWVLSRGRRLTTQEQERLFGLHVQPPRGGFSVAVRRPPGVSDRAWGAIIGNSIPVPLLARVLCKALPASGLLPAGAVRDVWDPRAE
jgi:site-specific DNA-cytosine methylase